MARIGVVMAFLWLGIGASWTSASGPRQGELARFPTFGAAFREPKGWAEQMRDKGKIVAWWTGPNSTSGSGGDHHDRVRPDSGSFSRGSRSGAGAELAWSGR